VFFGSEMEVIVGRAMLDEGFARRSFSEGGQPAFAKASAGETKKALLIAQQGFLNKR